MELQLRPGTRTDQLIVAPSGDLDLYASVSFANAVLSRIDTGCRRIVFDLSDLRYLDSSGVGALIRLLQKCRTVGGEIRVAHLGGSPRKVLEMSNIISLLRLYPSVEAALEGWS